MTLSPFIADHQRELLRRHNLDSFDALWNVEATLVDEPNRARGGISSVGYLTLEDADGRPQKFFLKRQSNYMIRSLRRPWGQPTAGREFYNIQRYARLGVPALEAACYAERKVNGHWQALLLTPALEGDLPLDDWFSRWGQLGYRLQQDLLLAAARLVGKLHDHGVIHNCLYPKHLFMRPLAEGAEARLIDLEKSRIYLIARRGRLRDLDALHRSSLAPSRTQRLRFLLAYLGKSRVDREAREWVSRLERRAAGRRKGES